ncbi:transcription initiation factor IIE subunit alpha [Nannizzia gypsea CBS 118893]|uniref:Transcription initiation factor IIE subunit alpha n=1 Tax=Arthroderma gypseum (strain ATCC MYA-4604 / CBS 118893) TaxID=535722 RepID=E4UQ86_ARTGP|nr:transcription initiation factor IIE subunit alpha [Nannizzia gypsea CBS 118893]EFQ99167.1 transcription initiation factor IIE subunit alpha [Nannizzia gypsea CBS 118893]
MDLAGTLIRMTARAFYETRHILVIDALFIHSVLNAEDLALLLGMQQKDVRKLCGRLREDRLIAVHHRTEMREGQTRPREYYYVPLYPVIDAIKYRVSRLTSSIKAQYTPNQERKEFICQRCSAEWTQLEVLGSVGPGGFECLRCNATLSPVDEVEGAAADRSGHEKNSKLMAQLDSILNLLIQIDSTEIPPNDFDTAWEHKVDVIRNQHTNPTKVAIAVNKKGSSAVKGVNKTDASALEVSLSSSAERNAEEQAQKEARKAALEKQNALPVWHTHSTVSTEASNLPTVKVEPNGAASTTTLAADATTEDSKVGIKDEDEEKKDMDDTIATYYAEMAREKELEAAESSDDEDEDDEEFEDVSATPDAGAQSDSATVTANGTPTVNGSGAGSANGTTAASGSSLKRELDSESGTSGPNTNAGTPITPAEEDGPAAKKVKMETETEPVVKKEEDVGSDEDEEEFEDV